MLTTILCIILLLMAIFLTVAVLMQHGKSHNLSGTIAGGAETFFGKTKGRSVDAMLSKVTTIVAIIFVILVVVVYVIQDDTVIYQEIPVEDNAVVEGAESTDGADVITNEAEEATNGDDATTNDAEEATDNAEVVDGAEEAVDNSEAAPADDAAPAEETADNSEEVTDNAETTPAE